MEELLASLRHEPYEDAHGLILIDTCFFIDAAERHKLSELLDARVAVTSFNARELVHVAHRLHADVKDEIRHFLKKHHELLVLDVPVVPGDVAAERAFVASIEPELLKKIPDASDAVLLAAAFATKSDVLTKDKHHLFTVTLENYVQRYGVHVWKEWKDAAKPKVWYCLN